MQRKKKADKRKDRNGTANGKTVAKKRKAVGAGGAVHADKQPKDYILNTELKDSGAKVIFDDKTLCSEFLRDYVRLPYCENVRPEDIIDVSERYVPLFGEERDGDVVKRINIENNNPFFFISLIEHKSKVDYNVTMQIFRYMIYIWEDYEKEMERKQKGISKLAGFRYPPIIPIVYYEGKQSWTVPRNFRDKIIHGAEYGKYIPDFEYYLVPLNDYSNEELMKHGNGISFVMMVNKLQSEADISDFRNLPQKQVSEILQKLPWNQRCVIGDVLMAALLKMNMPVSEVEELAGKVKEKNVSQLFENMEKMDIQLERRRTAEAERKAEEAERKAEKKVKEAEKEFSEVNIKSVIELCQEFGASEEIAVRKLVEKYGLSLEEAEKKVDEYWKNNR